MAKRSSIVAVLLYALIAAMLFAGTAAASGSSTSGEAVADELIVRFDGSLSDGEEDDEVVAAGALPDREVARDLRIKVVKVRPGEGATTAAKLRGRRGIAYVEPNYIVHAIAPAARSGALLATDPRFGELWGLRNTGQVVGGVTGTPGADISAATAWDVTTGSSAVVVGIVDTGIAYAHPDLAANVWSNPGVAGCPAGTHGFNAINGTCDPNDDNDHGSHVSGTIGAVGANGQGVVGVNWNVRLMGLKFLNAAGSGTTAGAISAIDFAVRAKQAGVNVRALNNSWGGGGFSQALLDKINQANAVGILFVAAAGNNNSNNDTTPHFPSSYDAPNVVAVAATTNTDARASFSNFGATSVDLGAPGVGILSTIRGGAYASFSGTSMATPHVAGVAALVLAVPAFANLTAAELKARILNSVDPIPSLAGITVTGGRLNASKAVGPATPDFSLSVTPASQTVAQGATATYTVNVSRTNFADPVALSATGLPADATVTFAPNPATGASSTLSVATTATTATGSYPFTVTGTGGALTRTATATLVVEPPPPPDFSLSVTPASQSVTQGGSATYTVSISRTGGFAGDVTLSASGLPAGATGTFTPNPAATSSTLAIATSAGTPAGSFTFTVTGTAGALTHSATATLVVNPPSDFSLSLSPQSVTTKAGGSAQYTITITRTGGFSASVALSVTGLPAGWRAELRPSSTTGTSSQLRIRTSSATAPGTYSFTVSGTSGALVRTTTGTVVLTPK